MELSVAIVRYSACRHRLPVCSKCIYDWYTGRESRLQLKGTNIRYVIKRPGSSYVRVYTQTQLVGGSFSVSHGRAYVREYEKRSMGENISEKPFSSAIRAQIQREMEIIFIATPTEKTLHIVARCTQTYLNWLASYIPLSPPSTSGGYHTHLLHCVRT